MPKSVSNAQIVVIKRNFPKHNLLNESSYWYTYKTKSTKPVSNGSEGKG